MTYAFGGQEEKARELLAEFKQRREQGYAPAVYQGYLYAALQDLDSAFECFHRAYEERDVTLFYLWWLKLCPASSR